MSADGTDASPRCSTSSTNHTNMLDDYDENCAEATPYFYSVPNLRITSGLSPSATSAHRPQCAARARFPASVLRPNRRLTDSQMRFEHGSSRLAFTQRSATRRGPSTSRSRRVTSQSAINWVRKNLGWYDRTATVGSMQRNGTVVGWGIVGCSWIADRLDCEVRVELRVNGEARVFCATQDIGTGTYTMLAQIASDALGIPVR